MSIPDINTIPIEDDPCDVIGKAMRGLDLSVNDLATESGMANRDIRRALDGDTSASLLEKIAGPLGLSAKALSGLASYRPDTIAPDGLTMIVSRFGHAGVNAFIVSRDGKAVIFDTGTDATPILKHLEKHHLEATAVIITHRHPDHTAGIKDFGTTPILFPEDTSHDESIDYAGMEFTALDVSGHAQPARAYYHQQLNSPLCMVGDAMFAGSIGGAPDRSSYAQALRTIRENILTLPASTIICPGHGPMTTLELEQSHNPFTAKV